MNSLALENLHQVLSRHVEHSTSSEVECPTCRGLNAEEAGTCRACGAVLPSEDRPLSLLTGPVRASVICLSLENAPHYRLFKHAFHGIQDGRLSHDEYRQIVFKLRILAAESLQVLTSKEVERRFVREPLEVRQTRDRMRSGFVLVEQGMVRMASYLASHDLCALNEGAAAADKGFRLVERARDCAAAFEAA